MSVSSHAAGASMPPRTAAAGWSGLGGARDSQRTPTLATRSMSRTYTSSYSRCAYRHAASPSLLRNSLAGGAPAQPPARYLMHTRTTARAAPGPSVDGAHVAHTSDPHGFTAAIGTRLVAVRMDGGEMILAEPSCRS